MWARNAANATANAKRKRSAADDPGASGTAPEPIEPEACPKISPSLGVF